MIDTSDEVREVLTPAQHRQIAEALLAEAGTVALAAQILAERAQLHGVLATKTGAGEAYANADGAAGELAAMAERGELGPEALDNNWFVAARRMAESAEGPVTP